MKKLFNCLVVILMTFTLFGCANKEEEKSYEYSFSGTEIVERIQNDETFVVYLGTTTCSHCLAFGKLVPTYNEEYNVEIGHVVLDEIETSDPEGYQALMEVLVIEYTPTTFFIIDGEIAESVVGVIEEADMVDYLVKHGFLPEGTTVNE